MTATRQHATWATASVDATLALGEALGRSLIGGLTVGLVGPLGAGKTVFVKGIAAGNAVDDVRKVTSPTFTLVHEYPGRLLLYHLDAYRLRGPADLLALGFDELIRHGSAMEPTFQSSAVVVEWADRVRPAMPDDTLWVELTITGEANRTLTLRASGDRADRSLEALQAAYR